MQRKGQGAFSRLDGAGDIRNINPAKPGPERQQDGGDARKGNGVLPGGATGRGKELEELGELEILCCRRERRRTGRKERQLLYCPGRPQGRTKARTRRRKTYMRQDIPARAGRGTGRV